MPDGATFVLKRTSGKFDRVAQLTDGAAREASLFLSGVLDMCPWPAGHAILDAWRSEEDEWNILMSDVSDGLIPNTHRATLDQVTAVLNGVTAIHHKFVDVERPSDLCSLAVSISHLHPDPIRSVELNDDSFCMAVLEGWDVFFDFVPRTVRSMVADVHGDPEGFAGLLKRYPCTLLHGDLWLVNVSLTANRVVFLDWTLSTWGPPAVDLAILLAGHGSRMEPSRRTVTSEFVRRIGVLHHPDALRLSLLMALSLMGWNKALDAVRHPEPEVRQRELSDLAWWIRHATRI